MKRTDVNNEQVQELVNAAADGELTPERQAEYEQLLAQVPEVRELQAGLERMAAVLRDLPPPNLPESLHQEIMARVPVKRSGGRVANRAQPDRSPAVVPYMLAAAAGLVVAVVFYEGRSAAFNASYSTDTSELVGTMAPGRNRAEATVLDSWSFDEKGLESRVRLERRDDRYLVEVEIDAVEPVEVTIDLSASGLALNALVQREGPVDSFEYGGQKLRIAARAATEGRHRITAHLHRTGESGLAGEPKIDLDYSSRGKLLQQGSLIPVW